MSTIRVIESNMCFEVEEENSFRIEKDEYVKLAKGVKSCEFVVWNGEKVELTEAKTSLSNPATSEDNFNVNIQEISVKFAHSLQLFVASQIGRFKVDDVVKLPESVDGIDWSKVMIVFYLVIKNHKKEWLFPVSEALKKEMKPLMKCWNISDVSVKVLNEEMALDRGLIVPMN